MISARSSSRGGAAVAGARGRAAAAPRVAHQRWPVRPRGSVAARVANVTQDSFEAEVLKSDKPVLIDFWAEWCGPCKLVSPLMDWVEEEYNGAIKVVKVEHDANPKLIEEFKVYGLPALVMMKDGVIVPGSKREGAISKGLLQQYLANNGMSA